MQAYAVVETVDIVGDISYSFTVIGVIKLPNALHFEIQKESLHDSVIPAIGLAVHASAQTVTGQRAMNIAGILATRVRLNDKPGTGLPMCNGHQQSRANQFSGHA